MKIVLTNNNFSGLLTHPGKHMSWVYMNGKTLLIELKDWQHAIE